MSKINFQKENNEFLECLLNKRFFEPWKENFQSDFMIDETSLANDACLELFITPTCNQKCEYCYLIKHPELYPKEFNDQKLIIKNLNILLNWLIDNNYAIHTIELFSGEIWHTNFGEEVLKTFLNAIKNGFKTGQIIIPSNCSFVRQKKVLEKIQYYISSFTELGVTLTFSISIDGKIIEDYSRPTNDKNDYKDDDFYETLFSFARFNKFLFHPMVSASNVKDWIENFQWWEKMFEEFDGDIETDIMLLEVRDGNWNEEAIEHYKNFLNYLLDYKAKKHKNIEELTRSLFFIDIFENNHYSRFSNDNDIGYFPIYLPESNITPGCSIATYLTIRLGDLAICPCHRTAYDKYLYGHFEMEDEKIIGIKANNIQMATHVLLGNTRFNLGCSTCIFKNYCLKGCYGAQLEDNRDPFVPNPVICNFFKEKITFILKKYKELGVIDYLQQITPYTYNYLKVQQFLKFYNEVKDRYELE